MPLLRATDLSDCTTPLPAVNHRHITPVRTAIAAAAVLAVSVITALALVTVPAGPALGAADALTAPAVAAAPVTAPAVAAAPVTAADLGSPALDKAQRAAATSLATATAAILALHQAHLAHQAHLSVLARKAAQAKAAATARQQLVTEHVAAKKAASVAPVSRSGGSAPASSSPPAGCSDPSGHLTASQMTMLWLCAGGPSWAVSHALSIAMCESGWSTFAYNPSGATGLWQILGQVTAFWGRLTDARVNALNAVAKFRASGDTFAQWVCR